MAGALVGSETKLVLRKSGPWIRTVLDCFLTIFSPSVSVFKIINIALRQECKSRLLWPFLFLLVCLLIPDTQMTRTIVNVSDSFENHEFSLLCATIYQIGLQTSTWYIEDLDTERIKVWSCLALEWKRRMCTKVRVLTIPPAEMPEQLNLVTWKSPTKAHKASLNIFLKERSFAAQPYLSSFNLSYA